MEGFQDLKNFRKVVIISKQSPLGDWLDGTGLDKNHESNSICVVP
jgi:hypothetical protein